MIVELPGNSARFADVPADTFFAFWRKSERLHGLTVTEGTATSAIMFFDNGRGYPWLAVGGLPNDQILAFPEAVLRPDISSAIDGRTGFSAGAVISVPSGTYMHAVEF